MAASATVSISATSQEFAFRNNNVSKVASLNSLRHGTSICSAALNSLSTGADDDNYSEQVSNSECYMSTEEWNRVKQF